MRILIVDDHAIIRRGLRQIVEEGCPDSLFTEAATGQEALQYIRTRTFDVVMLDIALPDISGVDVLKCIHAEKPELPVLMLSIYPEEQYAVRLIKAGAAGYLNKETAPQEVIRAIHIVANRKKYISVKVAEILAEELSSSMDMPSYQKLSNRELQIFKLLALAKTITEIANSQALSAKTVSTYRRRILDKLHLKNNAELMRYALDNKLL